MSTPQASRSIALFRERVVGAWPYYRRRYPWRDTSDPFKLLLAEMMLRRTKADQVASVYEDLTRHYPNAGELAGASEDDLAAILRPIGLAWRVPAFRLAAMDICEKFGGAVPATREDLVTLPGVGAYVAGAVLSIGYGQREWIVDTNIVRVARRFFQIPTSREGRRDRAVIEFARRYADTDDPRAANLALLDFAAAICRARQPLCLECPVTVSCPHR